MIKKELSERSKEKVQGAIRETLVSLRGDQVILPSDTIYGDLGGDSLDLMEIVMRVEEDFCIEIPDQHADKLTSVGAIYEYLATERGIQ